MHALGANEGPKVESVSKANYMIEDFLSPLAIIVLK